jgi:hypothetical protein
MDSDRDAAIIADEKMRIRERRRLIACSEYGAHKMQLFIGRPFCSIAAVRAARDLPGRYEK